MFPSNLVLSLHHVVRAALVVVCVTGTSVSASTALAQTVVVDGDLDDTIALAEAVAAEGMSCGFVVSDPSGDNAGNGTATPCVPAPGGYFANGFDQTLGVFTYDRGNLYLGMRVAGAVGDTDGDGDPDAACASGDIPDSPGLDDGDRYLWEVDPLCGSEFDPAPISVKLVGDPSAPEGWTLHVTGLIYERAEVAFAGSDLEIQLVRVKLANGMPFEPLVSLRMQADSAVDGLPADLSDVVTCPTPKIVFTAKTYFEVDMVCPGDTVVVSASVMNWSLVTLWKVTLEDVLPEGWTYVPGSAVRIGEPEVNGTHLTFPDFPLWPVEGLWLYFKAVVGEDCDGAQTNRIISSGTLTPFECVDEAVTVGPLTERASVMCVAPAVSIELADAELCAGVPGEVPVTLTNEAALVQDLVLSCTVDGEVLPPVVLENVAGGESRQVMIPVPASPGGSVEVACSVESSLEVRSDCAQAAEASALVTVTVPAVTVKREVLMDDETSSGRVTVTVTNPGSSSLDPVVLTDHLNAGGFFDPNQTVSADCEVSVEEVDVTGGATTVSFTPFALAPGEACVISYDVACTVFDGKQRIDTARVEAWCEGSGEDASPAVAEDASASACSPLTACPRGLGWWRNQCRQEDNGSTKICREGVELLWRCVIEETQVERWLRNDGTYETTAELAALSNADLFERLCAQLEGPRNMTRENMAEIQHLVLMLNVCVGALPRHAPLLTAGGETQTVGDVLAGLEGALNHGGDTVTWAQTAAGVLRRMGAANGNCSHPNERFASLPGCHGNGVGGLIPSGLSLAAYPNPARAGGSNIQYSLPERLVGSDLVLEVFDVAGRRVRLLAATTAGAEGSVPWDLKDDQGTPVPTGLYFYCLRAGDEQRTERIMIMQR